MLGKLSTMGINPGRLMKQNSVLPPPVVKRNFVEKDTGRK